MEERIQRPATAFSNASNGYQASTLSQSDSCAARRFESPTLTEISLCCEISAYAPDGDDQPLF